MSGTRHFVWGASATLGVLGIVSGGCSNIVPMAADHGPVPLDSARAVAIARRSVCGAPNNATETTCVLQGYQRTDGRFVVVLERRPPAGNDRVAVTLRDNGMRVEVAQLTGDGARPNR